MPFSNLCVCALFRNNDFNNYNNKIAFRHTCRRAKICTVKHASIPSINLNFPSVDDDYFAQIFFFFVLRLRCVCVCVCCRNNKNLSKTQIKATWETNYIFKIIQAFRKWKRGTALLLLIETVCNFEWNVATFVLFFLDKVYLKLRLTTNWRSMTSFRLSELEAIKWNLIWLWLSNRCVTSAVNWMLSTFFETVIAVFNEYPMYVHSTAMALWYQSKWHALIVFIDFKHWNEHMSNVFVINERNNHYY